MNATIRKRSAALETATVAYLAAHFQSGVASVFSVAGNADQFIIQVVANKYNPANFWYVLCTIPGEGKIHVVDAFTGQDDGALNTLLISRSVR